MVKQNYVFDDNALSLLRSLIGKSFDFFVADNAFGCTKSFQHLLFSVDKKFYSINSKLFAVDYFGNGIEDVAVMSVSDADSDLVDNEMKFDRNTKVPVLQRVEDIEMVHETQTVVMKNGTQYEVSLTRGLIFKLSDGFELSIEKDVWFSEFIFILKGYDLIEKFTPTKEFESEWENCESVRCERKVYSIS